MSEKKNGTNKKKKPTSCFSVGKVHAHLRGRIWYLRYSENGLRKQPRVGPDRDHARQMAAEINSQLENSVPSTLGFEPLTIIELRNRWLGRHEDVRRSSLSTISRYRNATEYLIRFLTSECPVRRVSEFRPAHAEQFVRYLRSLRVSPNGHNHSRKRPLRDAGVKYILETCSSMFHYAVKSRHLPPYADNPFQVIEVGRIPIENSEPIIIFDEIQEKAFLNSCDPWQFPIFLTLFMTGMRPGELCHLLLEDIELKEKWIYIRNKPRLGWLVKTRTERAIPINSELATVLTQHLGGRKTGPVFLQKRCYQRGYTPPLITKTVKQLEIECQNRFDLTEDQSRRSSALVAKSIWQDLCGITSNILRLEFNKITQMIGMPEVTAPKSLRHTFATSLQDTNVDPLIRNELMGHSPNDGKSPGGLGMTAKYTHTRPETKRRQLEAALAKRPSVELARLWCQTLSHENNSTDPIHSSHGNHSGYLL